MGDLRISSRSWRRFLPSGIYCLVECYVHVRRYQCFWGDCFPSSLVKNVITLKMETTYSCHTYVVYTDLHGVEPRKYGILKRGSASTKFLGYMEHIVHCFCHELLDIYTQRIHVLLPLLCGSRTASRPRVTPLLAVGEVFVSVPRQWLSRSRGCKTWKEHYTAYTYPIPGSHTDIF